jgi:hypothetical protein
VSTFRDKFGRRDPDLSPRHDAIMWWLDEQLRSGKLVLTASAVDLVIEWESIIPLGTGPDRFPVAFVDMMVTFKAPDVEPRWSKPKVRVGFEIKPEIYSTGELLRQLKTYRHIDPSVDQWVVVSQANELAQRAVVREGFGWLDVPESVA